MPHPLLARHLLQDSQRVSMQLAQVAARGGDGDGEGDEAGTLELARDHIEAQVAVMEEQIAGLQEDVRCLPPLFLLVPPVPFLPVNPLSDVSFFTSFLTP